MRYVCPGLLVALSFLSPSGFAATGPALSVANYHLLGGVRQTRTVSLYTYSADLVNAGQAQPSITATVTSSVASIVVQPGQGSLHFPPAPANSTVTSTDFFTVLVDRTGNDDFSNLTWQFSAPVANAGPNQTVVAGATVTLNASASTNPSGIGTLAYAWAFAVANGRPAGSAAVIQNPGSVMPTFVADVAGNYNIVLTVSNGAGVDSSIVTVSTTNSPPVANAGPNQSLSVGSTVVLNGSASHDVDGNPLTYSWTLVSVPSGSLATLSGPTTVSPTFVADKVGTYKAQLLVNDGVVNSAPAQVTISSNETPPVASAGMSQVVAVGALVQLDGSKSTDVDGNVLTYRWSINSLPTGSVAVLSSTTIVNPTFTADVAGSYVAQLIVNDGLDDSPPSTVTISTNAVLAPTANAGPNQTVAHGSTVTLSGSGTDPQGLTLTYHWSVASKPAGSSATLSDPSIAGPSFVADLPGSYVLQLIVNDGTLNSSPSTVTITTTNTPPVANAGPNQIVAVGSIVTLDGSGSYDADNDPITYSWSFQSIPPGSTATLLGASIVSPTFVADLPGAYVVQLIAKDPFTSGKPATVTIVATSPSGITLSPNPLSLPLNSSGSLTVTIGSPAGASGQIINLAALDSTIAIVPPTVTIPAGKSSTTVTIAPTGNLGSTQIVASAAGFQPGSGTVNVTEPNITLTLSNTAVGITKTVTGTITLSAPVPTGGITVSLSAVPVGIVSFPASISIPSGNTGSFTVTGASSGTTTISAGSSGYVSGSATVTAATLGAITLPSGTIAVTGQTQPFAVTLVSAAPAGGVTVTLLSADTSKVIVSPSVFIDAGTTTPAVSAQISGVGIGSAAITASAAGFTGASTNVTVVAGLQVTPTSLPNGTVGVLYPTTTIHASGGTPPYVLSSVSLPAGLSFTTSTGVLSGTPTAAGTGSITVKDSSTTPLTQTLPLTVNATTLVITPASLSNGTVGVLYFTTTISASGGTTPYTMTAANLPAGLSFNATTGVLSGTPTAAGTGTITIKDSGSTPQSGTLSVTVNPASLVISPASLQNGTVGVLYPTTTISASGGTTPYIMTAANLPAGLSFNAATGVLSGTPTASGTGTIKVTDSAGTPQTGTLSVTVNPATLVISPASLPNGKVGTLYPAITVSASGGTTPYIMTAANLPAGLSFNAATGVLSGIPIATGTGTIKVTDSASTPQTGTLSVTVNPATLVIGPASLPNGAVGVLYPTTTVSASGGTTPYIMTAANLPAGLSFNAATGVLSGTPTAAGTGTITVTDSAGTPQSGTLSVTVNPAPLVISPASLQNGTVGVLYPATTISASGGTAPYIMTAATLPAGLSFNAATGVLSGTPTATGTGTITVRDSAGTPQTGTLSVTVYQSLTIAPASLSAGVAGSVYPTTTFTASGGIPPYVFSAANLPTGLSFDPIAGVLSGTPSAAGTGTINVHDSTSPVNMTASVSLTINPAPLVITTTSLVNGTVGVIYSATVAASGGTPPYTFSATGLPAGLSMSSIGQITGIPSTAGTSQVAVTVTDSSSSSASASIRRAGNVARRNSATATDSMSSPATTSATIPLTINPQPLVVSTSSLASGTVGVSYSQPLFATGGTPPYVWSIISGSLPSGLTLNPAGAIAGVPNGTGSLSTTVVLGVKDSGSPQLSAQSGILSVTISSPVLPPYLTVTGATVGQNLQTNIAVSLNNFVGSTNVTISSSNSNVLLAKLPGTVGSQSITVVGATTSFFLYVQGLANSGTATITAHATAAGAVDGTAVVTLAPSAFVLSGLNGIGASVLSNEGVTISMSVIATQLDSSGNPAQTQQLAAGLTQIVTLSNTNSAAGVVPASVTFTAGTDTVTFNFVGGTTAGTTIVTVNEPTGFTTPSQNANVVAVTVQATQLTPSNVTVGKNLEAAAQIVLSTGVSSDLVVTLTSSDSTKVLLSTDPTLPGTSTITMTVKAPSNHTQVFYVYGLASSGTSGYTATATGFGTTTGLVTLAPSGFVLEGPSGIGQDFFAVTGGYPTSVNVDSAILDGSGNYVQEQALAGGQSANVAVTSSLSSVGTVGSPVTITGGNYTATTQFTALGQGISLLSAVAPSGFSTPAQYSSLHATVNSPNILIDTGNNIGMNLELQGTIFLGASAPSSGASVVLTVTAGKVLLSPTATGSGSTSITVAIPAGQFIGTYYMYGQDTVGSAMITATSAGYNLGSGVETLTPSGVVIYGPNGLGYPLSASVSAGNTTVDVSTAQLDASDNFVQMQPLAPTSNGPLQAFLNSTVTTVGAFTSPAIILVGSGTATVQFTPLQTGSMVISVPTPPGFTTPAADATLAVTVGN